MNHTQLPWEVRKHDGQGSPPLFDVVTKTGLSICGAFSMSKQPAKENAEFIVTACNNHYNFMELLNAAKSLLADAHDREECYDEITGEMFDDFKQLTEAIDKCEGR